MAAYSGEQQTNEGAGRATNRSVAGRPQRELIHSLQSGPKGCKLMRSFQGGWGGVGHPSVCEILCRMAGSDGSVYRPGPCRLLGVEKCSVSVLVLLLILMKL